MTHENLTKVVVQNKLITRSSADADKPARRGFRGQSRSPNMVPSDTLGMISY